LQYSKEREKYLEEMNKLVNNESNLKQMASREREQNELIDQLKAKLEKKKLKIQELK